jgi:hypothetical protein
VKVTIEFETDNDAFQGRMLQGEVIKVLYQAQEKIGKMAVFKTEEMEMKLRDSNGNTVGYVRVTK